MAARSNKPKELTDIQRAFELTANTPEGLTVLKHIYELTGYGDDTMRADSNTGEINPIASLVNVSRRKIWLLLQQQLSARVRRLVEIQED